MMTELEHDILGNRINDMEKDESIKKYTLTFFRQRINLFVFGHGLIIMLVSMFPFQISF